MSSSDLSAILPLIVVAGWACILLLIDLFIPRTRKGITALLAAAGLLASMVLAAGRLGTRYTAFQGMIVADGFASFLQMVFLLSGLVGIALAYDYLKRQGIERGEYYTLLLFSISGMMLMAQAGDLIIVFLALELLSIPLYVLAGFARPREESEESAMKYFLLGAFASGFVVYGVALVFGATETTNLQGILATVQAGEASASLLLIGAGMILVGLGFKVAAVPFHMWTPDVYHGAPSAVTAFMSVGAKAGGFAALLRVFVTVFPDLGAQWAPVAMWVAALTMTWGNVAAIAQSNIKRMLAYSSIAHAGYILMALPAAAQDQVAQEAVSSVLFYLMAYAISNLGAWGVVLAVEKTEGQGLAIEDYAGLGARRPGLALAMAVFMLSLTGVPPMVGFMGKFYLFRAALDANLIWLAVVGVVTSLISAYYYLRVIVVMYMRAGEPVTRSEGWLNASLLLTALGTFVLGILPGPLFALIRQAGLLALGP
ncbi:MAG: NADH-quinone oxidoreductase subunit N [Anaerolineales bacterium]|jgi:NADH-quinone oxidoreductase subunit N